MPSASATVSLARMAAQARPERARRRLAHRMSVAAAAASRMKYQARGSVTALPAIVGGSTTMPVEKPRLASYSPPEIGDEKMQRQRADGQIEAAQAQRRQAEQDAQQHPDQRSGRQRDPERGMQLLEEDADGEGSGGQQAGVAERHLPGVARQQHEGERADHGEECLRGEIDQERRGDDREGEQRHDQNRQRHALQPRLEKRQVLAVVGAEVAAGAGPPRHGRALRGCRTGPRAAPPAWRSAPGTGRPRTAAGRRNGSAAPRRRRR